MFYTAFMQKMKIFLTATLTLTILWIGLMRLTEQVLIRNLPRLLADNMPALSIGKITRAGCIFQACLTAHNLTLSFPDSDLTVPRLTARLTPVYPPRLTLQTPPEGALIVDATLTPKRWEVRQLFARLSPLTVQAHGTLAPDSGALFVRTTGLKSYLTRLSILPAWLTYLAQDSAQTFPLTLRNGALAYKDIPLIYLDFWQR